MKTIMTHLFSKIPQGRQQRSQFKQPFGHKTTFDAGLIVPVYCKEILPGDTVALDMSFLARLATPIYPVMDNMYLDWFVFFTPNRLLWEHWVNLCGEKQSLTDTTDYVVPTLTNTPSALTFAEGTLGDYFGLPTGRTLSPTLINSLPFLAYNRIWNEWFRVPYLQDPVYQDTGDGPHAVSEFDLMRRAKRHDYFTSAFPEPQYGDAVALPIGTQAPVYGDGNALQFTDGASAKYLTSDNAGLLIGFDANATPPPVGTASGALESFLTNRFIGVRGTVDSGLIADLTAATAATINDMRQAIVTQHILEADMRGGTRYTEILHQVWGVHPEDSRLQRPEYLGGGSQIINVSQVPQNSASPATPLVKDVQGGLSAYAVQGAGGKAFKSFSEHGYLMVLVNVRSDITYQQGLEKMWTRSTRYDFFRPEQANLGEQAILNREIHYENGAASDDVWGYQERAAEYRYSRSYVSAAMRSDAATPLHAWHLALDFGVTVPTLSDTFIQDDPPIDRIVAVANQYDILFDCYIEATFTRCMPMYSVPGLDRL